MPGKSPHRWRGVSSRPYTRRMSTTVRKTRNYQNTPRQWPRLQTPDPCGQRENGGVLSSRAYLLFTMSWNKPSSPWASTETDLFHRNVLHEPTVAHLGGARRDRTDDFLLAKQALSQLSYGPEPVVNPVLVVRRSLDSVELQLMFRRLSAKRGGPGKT